MPSPSDAAQPKKRRGRPPKKDTVSVTTTAPSHDAKSKTKSGTRPGPKKTAPSAPAADDDLTDVSRKPKPTNVHAHSDNGPPRDNRDMLEKEVLSELQQREGRRDNEAANRTWERRGKEPVGNTGDGGGVEDAEMSHELVDEGSIHYSDVDPKEFEDTFDPDDADDARSHISIESANSTSKGRWSRYNPLHPWRMMGFSDRMRREWETMYCQVEPRPLSGEWSFTEDYQREKDKEMLRYIQDYPLPRWVIPKEQAEQAYFRMLERTRWRNLGIRIYGNSRIPEIIPNSTPFSRVAGPPVPQPVPPNPAVRPQLPHDPSPSQDRLPQSQQMHPVAPEAVPMSAPPVQVYHRPQQASMAPQGMMLPQHIAQTNLSVQAPHPGPYASEVPGGLYMLPEAHPNGRQSKKKRESPSPSTPPPPPPTPPYEKKEKPTARREFNKTGRRSQRKQAEALEFPWHRQGIDFNKARAEATWDISGYDQKILDGMAEVRKKNLPIIAKLDEELAEKQRQQRAHRTMKKKGLAPVEESSDAEGGRPGSRGGSIRGNKDNVGGDPYHSGNFAFTSEEDQNKALALQYKTADEVIEAAESGKLDWQLCKDIMICWNPTKKGTTQELVQAPFRVWDTLITRKQLPEVPILTRRAAECIVDFCPDMLWRETLLQIVSEAAYGNKDVRDRFCYNGCHADKATITKRIAAALGQKQFNNPKRRERQLKEKELQEKGEAPTKRRRGPAPKFKTERYAEGEEEWFNQNQHDFYNYTAFFGRRPGNRILVGARRKKSEGPEDVSDNEATSSKRARSETGDAEATMSSRSIDTTEELDQDGLERRNTRVEETDVMGEDRKETEGEGHEEAQDSESSDGDD